MIETPTEAIAGGSDDAVEDRITNIIEQLRARGQRLTPQRLAIIRNFVRRGDHPSAEALHRELRVDFPMVAISTVYKTLHALVEMGEAVEVSPASQEARFDPNTGNHCHLVCISCGSIEDFPMEFPPPSVPEPMVSDGRAFAPVLHVHHVYGYCGGCRAEGE